MDRKAWEREFWEAFDEAVGNDCVSDENMFIALYEGGYSFFDEVFETMDEEDLILGLAGVEEGALGRRESRKKKVEELKKAREEKRKKQEAGLKEMIKSRERACEKFLQSLKDKQ